MWLRLYFIIFMSLNAWADAESPNDDNLLINNYLQYKKSQLTSDLSEGKADHRTLLLTTGEDKAIDLTFDVNGGANGISYGNPQILTTTLVKIGDRRQLVIKPLKAGETNVTVRDQDGTIRLILFVRVTGTNLLRIKAELQSLLRDIEGIDLRIVGPKIVIEGDILVPSDFGKLLAVIQDKNYSDYVLNLAELSPLAMQVMAKKIQDDINTFAPNVKTRVVNGMIFLEGTVDSKDQSDHAVKIADLYLPDLRPGPLLEQDKNGNVQRHPPRQLVNNFIVINPAPAKKEEKLVRINVHFVELSKNYNKVFNFMWQPAYTENSQISLGQVQSPTVNTGTAVGAPVSNGFSFGATISSLIPKLDSLQAAGYGRILKTGTLVVRNNEPAKLAEQTDYPVTVIGPNGQASSSSKTVGLSIAVTPSIIGKTEDIQLKLELNQTNVTGRAPVAGGAPTTAVHKIMTDIFIRSEESAAVASVSASTIGTNFNTDPPYDGSYDPGSGTTALFTLMRSKSYSKQNSRFVIFVTPEILDNVSDGTDDLKKNFRVKVN